MSVVRIAWAVLVVLVPFGVAHARVRSPGSYSWSGCHVGGTAGVVSVNNKLDRRPVGGFDGFYTPEQKAYWAQYDSTDETRGAFGLLAGCDWQSGHLVFGGEADLSWADYDQSIFTSRPNNSALNLNGYGMDVDTKFNWFSTLRARAGFAWNRSLIYVTGGLAITKVESNFDFTFNRTNFGYAGSDKSTRTGWTIGGGFEQALGGNWTLKGEYLYVDFGSFSYGAPNTTGPGGAIDPTYVWDTDTTLSEQVVRTALSYRF